MGHINFFQKRHLAYDYRTLVAGGGLLVVFCIGFFGVQKWMTAHLASSVKKLQREVILLRSETQEGSKMSDKAKEKETFFEHMKHRVDWGKVLEGIAYSAAPSGVWISAIVATVDKRPRVSLEGYARSPHAVTGFLEHLRESKKFSSVVLKASEQESDDDVGVSQRRYKISCEIQP